MEQYQQKISQAVFDRDLVAETSIRNPDAVGDFEAIPFSPTVLSQAKDDWLKAGKTYTFLIFTIHQDDFASWIEKSNQWPIAG